MKRSNYVGRTANDRVRGLVLLFAIGVACVGQAQVHMDKGYGAAMVAEAGELLAANDTTGALDRLSQVHRNDSLYERCLLASVRIMKAQKDMDGVVRMAKKGEAFDGPELVSFKVLRGGALFDLKRYDDCIALADSMQLEFPGLFRPHYLKAIALSGKGEKNAALEKAMENAKLYPYQREAHLLLATMAASESKVAQASLANMMAQIVRFDDAVAENILSYNDGLLGGTVEPKPDGFDLSITKDHLSEIDQLIRSRVAMDSKYKVKPDLSYPMCRQSHLLFTEVVALDFEEQGFFVNYYGPVVKAMMEKGMFEGYVYHCLAASTAPKVNSIATKNKSKVLAFRGSIGSVIDEALCITPSDNGVGEMYRLYNGDGDLIGMGRTDAAREKSMGEWVFYHPNGKLMSQGMFDEEGSKVGMWTYWYDNGQVQNRLNYKAGVKDGYSNSYDRYGAIQDSVMYVDGIRQGTGCRFHSTGGRSTCKTVKDDEWTGPVVEHYPTGAQEWSYSTVNDVAEGKVTQTYPDGTVQFEGTYSNGVRVGTFSDYHSNGQLSSRYEYVNGEMEGPYTKWYMDGTVSEEGTMLKGRAVGESKEYDRWGTLNKISRFDDQGRLQGIQHEYDRDGLPYFETEFKNSLLVRYAYYDRSGNKINEGTRTKGKFDLKGYYAEGPIKVQGTYLDEGAKDGPWTYFYPDGTKEIEENHEKGVTKGVQRFYSEDGSPNGLNDFYDRNGNTYRTYVGYHPSGGLREVAQRLGDDYEGVSTKYDPDGTVRSVEYYSNGSRDGWQDYYDAAGILERSDLYRDGLVMERVNYDTQGVEYERIKTLPGNRHLVQHYPSGAVKSDIEMVNGLLHGKALWTYPDGSKEVEGQFVNGDRHGKWNYYHANGKKHLEREYGYGLQTGTLIEYTTEGIKLSEYGYVNGDRHGVSKEFHANGKIAFVRNYQHDERHGPYLSYSWNGTPQMARFYNKGALVAYGFSAADDSVKDTIPLGIGTVHLKTLYPDGTPSREMTYRNDELDGLFTEYHPNGRIMEQVTYRVGKAEGDMTAYYESGKVRSVSPYKDGFLHGVQKSYWENGQLKETRNYVYGDDHGEHTFHDQSGKLLVTYVMRSDDVLEIRK